MRETRIYKNEDVEAVYAVIPPGHKHVRIVIKTRNEVLVFQEASIAGVVRAYLNVILHPTRRAVALKRVRVAEGRKPGYAEYQLVEVSVDGSAMREVESLFKELKEP